VELLPCTLRSVCPNVTTDASPLATPTVIASNTSGTQEASFPLWASLTIALGGAALVLGGVGLWVGYRRKQQQHGQVLPGSTPAPASEGMEPGVAVVHKAFA
jgi:hypothetical protein